MVKKTLLSLAIAATTLTIAGCNLSTTDSYDNKIVNNPAGSGVNASMPETSTFYPIFAPENSQLPLANDFVFAINSQLSAGSPGKDGTANTADTTPPVTTGLNRLAGFSTIAPIYIPFSQDIASASVIAGSTVFLMKLNNAEFNAAIDPLDLSSIANNSVQGSVVNPFQMTQPTAGTDYTADVVSLDGKPAIRILPLKPLSPKTKYIVALTNSIVSSVGTASSGSPTYELVTGSGVLPSASLNGVRTLVQNWEKMAGGALAVKSSGAITQDNLILTYAFTTDGSQDVLKSYAAPALFVKSQLTVAKAEALTDKLSSVPEGFYVVARKVYLAGTGNFLPTSAELAAVPEAAVNGTRDTDAYKVQLFNAIANTELSGTALKDAANSPKARTVFTVPQANVDTAINNAMSTTYGASPAVLLSAAGSTDTNTRFVQGTIELPDFLGGVTKTNMAGATDETEITKRVTAAMRGDKTWTGNTSVGALLDNALGNASGTTPPKDVNGVANVTYRYPFPQTVGTNSAPFILTKPAKINYVTQYPGAGAAADCSSLTKFKTVIFVHGITSNRSASVMLGAELAKRCIATVAIDLPLHGLAPADGTTAIFSLDTANRSSTSSPWAGVAAALSKTVVERHGNITQDSNSIRKDMVYGSTDGGSSGSAFINLQNFARTHDNLRQAVSDLLNLNASLTNIDSELDTDKVMVIGHSLGGIVASAFVAANNDPVVQAHVGKTATNPTGSLPKIKGLIIAGSGAHLTKLLENSPGFAPTIVGGLSKANLTQGSENYEKFLTVFQSLIDGVDPANTAKALTADVPAVQSLVIKGDGTLTNLPDTTVPLYDYFAWTTTSTPPNPFYSAIQPPCFEDPSATGCDAAGVIKLPNKTVPTARAPFAGAAGIATHIGTSNVVEYTSGTHSSFAKPSSASDAAFNGIVTQAVTMAGSL